MTGPLVQSGQLRVAQGTQGSVRDCLFNGNAADYGGAVFRGSTTGDISDCVFVSNRASKIGGAVYDSHVQVCSHAPSVSCQPATRRVLL